MLLPRKSDPFSEADLLGKVWRSAIGQQRNTPTLLVTTAQERAILPYAYFQEARIQQDASGWTIELFWPTTIVTVRGQNLFRMVELIADQSLSSLELNPKGVKSPREDEAHFESLTVTRLENRVSPSPVEAKPQEGLRAVHRQCYSVA